MQLRYTALLFVILPKPGSFLFGKKTKVEKELKNMPSKIFGFASGRLGPVYCIFSCIQQLSLKSVEISIKKSSLLLYSMKRLTNVDYHFVTF